MCLIIKRQKPQKATEDITVYKLVDILEIKDHDTGVIVEKKIVCKYHHSEFTYELNKIYETEMKEEKEDLKLHGSKTESDAYFGIGYERSEKFGLQLINDHMLIGQGFHSFAEKIIIGHGGMTETMCNAKCIIPKDSLYYHNNADMLVSNKIKIVELLDEKPTVLRTSFRYNVENEMKNS